MDIVNFLLELMDVMNQLFAMIGDGTNANLLLIQQLFKTSVEKVLYHEDFINMYEVMAPIGVILVVLYFSLDLMDKVAMEQVSVEKIILTFTKIVVGVALVNNGLVIFRGLNAFSIVVVDTINSALGLDGTIGTIPIRSGEAEATAAVHSIAGIIKVFLAILNPIALMASLEDFLTVLIFVFLIPIIAYQRAVKIGLYCLLAPFALSDTIGKNAVNQRAIKYIFNLLKAFLEFPIIYYSCYLAFQLREADIFNGISIAFLIVLVTVIMNSRETIKTMVGV